ncbi:MAG: DUF3006 domain-containing protein [Candidatus Aureabacteria bacterium]|nr:DUF3006 domain-containing protein [Candidatus Auribacterota bacterium]
MKVRVIVDRIEEDLAVLEVAGEAIVEWPVAHLPPGIRDGTVMDVTFAVNPDAERAQRARVASLQKELLERTKKIEEKGR